MKYAGGEPLLRLGWMPPRKESAGDRADRNGLGPQWALPSNGLLPRDMLVLGHHMLSTHFFPWINRTGLFLRSLAQDAAVCAVIRSLGPGRRAAIWAQGCAF